MVSLPTVSIVVATRERARQLGLALTAASQALASVVAEYIVLDQPQNCRPWAVCAEVLPIRYLHWLAVGTSHNGNSGGQVAKGHWVLFLDDNAVLEELWDQDLLWVLALSDRVSLVALLHLAATGKPLTGVTRDRPARIDATSLWSAWGLSVARRRDGLLRVRGFNARLGVSRRWGGAKGWNLTLRPTDEGRVCVVEPSLVVTQPPALDGRRDTHRRGSRFSLGIGALLHTHQDRPWPRLARSGMPHPLWPGQYVPPHYTIAVRRAGRRRRWLSRSVRPTALGAGRVFRQPPLSVRKLRRRGGRQDGQPRSFEHVTRRHGGVGQCRCVIGLSSRLAER
jgi:hypothetical protein